MIMIIFGAGAVVIWLFHVLADALSRIKALETRATQLEDAVTKPAPQPRRAGFQ